MDALRIGKMVCESVSEDGTVVLKVEHLEGVPPKAAYPENLTVTITGSVLGRTFWKPGETYSGRVLHGAGVGAL